MPAKRTLYNATAVVSSLNDVINALSVPFNNPSAIAAKSELRRVAIVSRYFAAKFVIFSVICTLLIASVSYTSVRVNLIVRKVQHFSSVDKV